MDEAQQQPESSAKLLKQDRDFVVPGDKIVSSMDYLPGKNCFRDGDSIYSKRLGIIHLENHVISVVPLSGAYMPLPGDMVIGEVEEIQGNGWFIDMGVPNSTYLSLSGVRGYVRSGTDLTRIYNIGDLIYVKIVSVSKQGLSLSMQDDRSRKLAGGRIINVAPVKVPRVIGKQGSMISLIKRRTGCNIVVGQNGLIWLQGAEEALATTVIKMVERESHKEGLTEMIEKYLDEHAPKILPPAPQEQQESAGSFKQFQDEKKDIFGDGDQNQGGENA